MASLVFPPDSGVAGQHPALIRPCHVDQSGVVHFGSTRREAILAAATNGPDPGVPSIHAPSTNK